MSVTISGLPPAASLTGDEFVPIVQTSHTVRTTVQAIADLGGGGGGGSFANPTATIGLTVVNGVATTALRSDAAPPLSQAIVPTWSGAHTFDSTATFNDTTTYLESEIGWRDLPQTLLSPVDDYTFAITDRGKHVYVTGESGADLNYTIPAAADVAFPIGAVITVVSGISADIFIEGDTDVTLVLAGSGVVGSVTLSDTGMATLLNVAENTWFINGVGLT